jgi:hypothetical protein
VPPAHQVASNSAVSFIEARPSIDADTAAMDRIEQQQQQYSNAMARFAAKLANKSSIPA